MKVVRNHAAKLATPYLQEWLPKMIADGLPATTLAVDIGCGMGRNTEFLLAHEIHTVALDQMPDYPKAILWVAGNKLPVKTNTAGLILLQYVWMFLGALQKTELAHEISRIAKPTCILVFELQDVKSAPRTSVNNFVDELGAAGIPGWHTIHRTKQRCILQRKRRQGQNLRNRSNK